MEKYVITLSRQFASLGRSIAQEMSEKLGIEFYDRDLVEATANRMGQPISVISNEEEISKVKFYRRMYPLGMANANMQDEIFEVQKNIIRDVALKESCIIVGRCANSILADMPRTLNVFIYAPYEMRLKNCIEVLQMKPQNAKRMIKEVDKAREKYRKRYTGAEGPFDGYDIIIDSSRFGVSGTAELLIDTVKKQFKG